MLEFTTFDGLALAIGAMVAGLLLLIKGGDWTVDSAIYIARKHGISPLIVGFTIVAFGTSLPELIVSVIANMKGSSGIALGNVLGSNIANILLVIGVGAIFSTLKTNAKAVQKDLIMMMIATLVIMGLLFHGEIGRIAGLFMVMALLAYIFLQYGWAKKEENKSQEQQEQGQEEDVPVFAKAYEPYMYLMFGLIVIALGAEFLVRGATVSADVIGVPDAVIALSVIAFGTSLPELSTSIIAARKGHSEIVLGNIIGSNVFNILMIMGVTTLIKPIAQGSFTPQLVQFDIWVVLISSLLFSALLLFYQKITKPIGIIFFISYLLYNAYIYSIYVSA